MSSIPIDDAPGRGAEIADSPNRFWKPVLAQPSALIAFTFIFLVSLAAILAPRIAPYTATQVDFAHVLAGPTWGHPLGTDELGRDILSRLIYGGRVSLLGPVYVLIVALGLGVTLGMIAGYSEGWVDRAMTRGLDLLMSIPVIIMLLAVVTIFGRNEAATMIALGVFISPGVARVIRGATRAIRKELFIDAARVVGVRDDQVIVRHVFPGILGPVIVQATLLAAGALLIEAGLGYLGLGVQPPTASWGGMIGDAATYIHTQAWMLIPPGFWLP